jgi:aminoglycoside phosphotransferase (APT) family kinase protein
MIDPLLQEQVQIILRASGWAQDAVQRPTIEAVNNSFQNKGNVFKIDLPNARSFVIKFDHPFFESHLDREAHLLAFLSTTPVPTPRLIHTGTCTVYHIDKLFPNYILMEYLDGIPLNWVYYRADRDERRGYLRQVVELIATLTIFQVRHAAATPRIGSPAGRITHHDRFVGCDQLAPFNKEPVGPFVTIDEMFQQQIAYWLLQLRAHPQGHYAIDLETAWQRLDRAVLSHDVPICLAHADIAPMNIMVDPLTRRLIGLIDWEFAGFYPADMDFHSVLYYDRYQAWKWCGDEDVRMAHELMQEQQIHPPEGYEDRLIWFDLLQLIKDLCHYHQWFVDAPDTRSQYEHALAHRLRMLFAQVGVTPAQ